MNASSSPPPGGPARTVFEIGAPIDPSAAESGSTSGRGRVIAWSGFAVVAVMGIALTNLSGLGDQSPPRTEPAAARQPPLSWNSPATEPIATADAADTTGQKPEAPAKAAAKPAATPAAKPAAKPKAKPTPTPTAPSGDQGLVQPGTRCRSKDHHGFTRNGVPVDCMRRHRGGQLRWQPSGSETGWNDQNGWNQDDWNKQNGWNSQDSWNKQDGWNQDGWSGWNTQDQSRPSGWDATPQQANPWPW